MRVGIDLGTSNIVVCEASRGEYNYIHIESTGNTMMPSSLMYVRGRIIVGTEAKNGRLRFPLNYISGSKVHMGSDKVWNIEERTFTPELVAEELLKKVYSRLNNIKTKQDEEIIATITVPACFSQKQVELTELAARNAGINVKNIVLEPIAAAKAAGIERQWGYLFVVDVGGGTLDISVVENSKTDRGIITQVAAVGGSAVLGGNDFDKAVYDKILIPEVKKSNGEAFEDKMSEEELALAKTRLFSIAEQIKCHFQESDSVFREDLFTEFENEVNLTVDLEQYNRAITECVSSAERAIRDVVRYVNDELGVAVEDMNAIIVGGMAKEKRLKDILFDIFGREKVTEVGRPLTAVAEGAARYAAERSSNVPAMLSSDIGIMALKNGVKGFHTVLTKNTILNETVTERISVRNAYNNASTMRIEIYERDARGLNHYKDISIPTERKPIGENHVQLDFCLDTNRILKIRATYIGHELEVTETIAVRQ